MTCQRCVKRVREALLSVEGVVSADVALGESEGAEGSAIVAGGDAPKLVDAVVGRGYSASLWKKDRVGLEAGDEKVEHRLSVTGR